MNTGQYPQSRNGGGQGVLVGVLSNELARFSGFFQSLLGVMGNLPPGSGLGWAKGVNIPKACNSLVEQMLGGPYGWLWVMGDDHTFEPDIAVRLLEHDVDVIVPHCLKRYPPWMSVVFESQDDDGYYVPADLPEESLTEIHAAGSAGMLIRRRVLETLANPWFAPSPDAGGLNEDLHFCQKAREAGFQLWCDPSVILGHITLATVKPTWSEGQWHPAMVHDGQVEVRYNRANVPVVTEADRKLGHIHDMMKEREAV